MYDPNRYVLYLECRTMSGAMLVLARGFSASSLIVMDREAITEYL